MRGELLTLAIPYGPFRFITGVWPGLGPDMSEAGWNNSPDRGRKNDVFIAGGLMYDSGCLSMVGAAFVKKFHGILEVKRYGLPTGLKRAGDNYEFIPCLP